MSRTISFQITVTNGTPELRQSFLDNCSVGLLANTYTQLSPTLYSIVIPYTDDIRFWFTLFCDVINSTKNETYNALQVVVDVALPFSVTFATIT